MTRVLVIGMHHINVTQPQWNQSKTSSHYNVPAIDLGGEDTGIDYYRALDGDYKCIGGTVNSWGTGFIPVDENGQPEEVMLADGTIGYYGIFLVHSNLKYTRGKIYKKGQVIYQEGNYTGYANRSMGYHIHLEVFNYNPKTCKVPKRVKVKDNIYNTYRFSDSSYIDPSELWIATDYSKIVNLNGMAFGLTTLKDCTQ